MEALIILANEKGRFYIIVKDKEEIYKIYSSHLKNFLKADKSFGIRWKLTIFGETRNIHYPEFDALFNAVSQTEICKNNGNFATFVVDKGDNKERTYYISYCSDWSPDKTLKIIKNEEES